MLIFGLTGNTGTGKTTVASSLERRGVPVVDADRLAREVVQPGQPALNEIAAAFGREYTDEAGQLRRQALGRLVFGDVAARRTLEQITHPRIAELARARFDAHRAAGNHMAVYDSAILVESGMASAFAGLIVVTTSRDIQLDRIVARDGLTKTDAAHRIDAQMPLSQKAAVADFVIDNSGSLADLEVHIVELLNWMRSRLD